MNHWKTTNQFGDEITRTLLQKISDGPPPVYKALYRYHDDQIDRAITGSLKKVKDYVSKKRSRIANKKLRMRWSY